MKPHTVILGAGATIAAIPNGDKNGKKSSVMNNLIDSLGLSKVLDGVELITDSNNLEDIYSELKGRSEYSHMVYKLERKLYEYFDSLILPEEPTIYDLLILSLTDKDCIATFNWDSLLVQAYIRCKKITNNLPKILCLHGNVGIGYCEIDGEYGVKGTYCPKCYNELSPTKLLYPVKLKDYSGDEYIDRAWKELEQYINDSYMITIFGYSAPKSDKNAIDLMKKAWGDKNKRKFEEISIIDIVEKEEVKKNWEEFIYNNHFKYCTSFFDSYLAYFPRKTCESVLEMKSYNFLPRTTNKYSEGMSWEELKTIKFD